MIVTNFSDGYKSFPIQRGLSEEKMKRQYGSVENWYAACARWIGAFYNITSPFSDRYGMGYMGGNYGLNLGEAEQIVENFLFYQGEQKLREFFYLVQDTSTTARLSTEMGQPSVSILPTPWIKGQKVFNLVSFMQGTFAGRISAARLSVENKSQKVRTVRNELINRAKLKYEFKEIFDQLNEQTGVEYNPFPGQNFDNVDDAIAWITKTPQEKSEREALRIIRKIDDDNNTKYIMEKCFRNMAIGRYGAIYVYIDKTGRLCQTDISPQNLIIDRRVDDDFGKGEMFAGFIEFLTPEEIITKHDLTEDEKEDMLNFSNRAISRDVNFWAFAGNNNGNYLWWDLSRQGISKIACLSTFWISWKDGRYKKNEKNGHWEKLNPNQKDAKGDYEVMTVRKCTLIGNRYVTNYGEEDCVVYDPHRPRYPLLPVRHVAPNTVAGFNKSVVDRIKYYQNKLDALENKINTHISRDFGDAYVFNANVAKGTNPEELLGDIKKYGITLINRQDGEDMRFQEKEWVVEKIDMNLSSNIAQYINLYRETERLMEEATSTSKIALGQQQTYVGLSTQQNTISQNTKGSEYLYSSALKFYADVQQYSLEKFKLAFLYGQNTEIVKGITDERGMRFLKEIKEIPFHKISVQVHLEDIIDEQMKAQLLSAAFAGLQAGTIEYRDYVNMLQITTYSEMKAYMDEAMNRAERKRQQEMVLQQMMQTASQQAAIQAQSQGVLRQTAMKEQGQNDRALLEAGVEGAKLNAQMLNQTSGLPVKK